jgi:type I restriction enzyme R subunit
MMIRDHIAANFGIETDDVQDVLVSRETGMSGTADFDYAPFAQEGGLGKVHQLFGEELNVIIEELNEALAA